MIYRTYIPPPPLADFVAVFWPYEGFETPHAKERVLPTGTLELGINLRDDTLRVYDRHNHNRVQRFRGSLICGAQAECFVIDTASQAAIMGVHFKPVRLISREQQGEQLNHVPLPD